jgi:hypothetical protein
MIRPDHPYNLILEYLKGQLSNRQRHVVEKEAMRDKFEEEALDGFNEIEVSDLEHDITELKQKLAQRIKKNKTLPILFPLKIAASVILLFGLAIAIKLLITENPVAPDLDKITARKEIVTVEKKTTVTAKLIIAQKTEPPQVEKKEPVASKMEHSDEIIVNAAEPSYEARKFRLSIMTGQKWLPLL